MTKLSNEELAREAGRWVHRDVDLSGWEDAPDAVPRNAESIPISLRLPKKMLEVLREFARREGVGYQVLMKRWLDDRIRTEASEVRRRASVIVLQQPQFLQVAASFRPPKDVLFKDQEDEHA
ncbi:MAG TPA: CopG family antitoxin [Anaeromyxobacteraceae bacterium]|nr:CopG family antitoxin [Anaeromyxobacteraceae bacterium]